jgi:SAM-dependent methyltransferase
VTGRRRYDVTARFYDVMSLERAVYRAGREAGIAALGLRRGDRVLDVGCGTGLNLPLLRDAVGPSGVVVGLDASAAMLRQARARIRRHGWTNVTTVLADAAGPARLPRRRVRSAPSPLACGDDRRRGRVACDPARRSHPRRGGNPPARSARAVTGHLTDPRITPEITQRWAMT